MRTAYLAAAAGAMALSFFAVAPASATTWNVVADFSTAPQLSSNVWQYGWDERSNPDSGFKLFNNGHANCIIGGVSCWQSLETEKYFVPLVAKNTTDHTLTYANTVVHPDDVLNLHPGGSADFSGGTDIDTIVRFHAPKAGDYRFTGFFEALDTNPSGVNILAGTTPIYLADPHGPNGAANGGNPFGDGPFSVGARTNFDFRVSILNPGDNVDFVVNRQGFYGNDSTGLALTVAVPEPATWGLMIMGFGGIGAMLRSSRRRTVAATA